MLLFMSSLLRLPLISFVTHIIYSADFTLSILLLFTSLALMPIFASFVTIFIQHTSRVFLFLLCPFVLCPSSLPFCTIFLQHTSFSSIVPASISLKPFLLFSKYIFSLLYTLLLLLCSPLLYPSFLSHYIQLSTSLSSSLPLFLCPFILSL